jgi:proteasome accessory factor B
MGAPVAFNPLENGYEYTEEGFALPDVQMTEGEVLALMVADKALSAYRGTECEEMLRQLLAKATLALGEVRTVNPQKLAEAYSFLHTSPPARVRPAVFAAIERAIRLRETLEVIYHTQSRGETGRRTLDPYHLANVDGDWFLLAWCHRRQEVRTFKPARIREAVPTGKCFLPEAFDPEEFLRTKIGTMGGEKIFESVVRFDETLAGHILERDWPDGYQVQILTGGGVDLSFRSENASALIRWCLGWGPGALIVSPVWVRRRALQVLKVLGASYERAPRDGSMRPLRMIQRRSRPPSRSSNA